MKPYYCENTYCIAEAVKAVFVSVKTTSDEKRNLCSTCYEAYIWGCQHGRKMEEFKNIHLNKNKGKVIVEVLGGVAECTQCPDNVNVKIIDHD
tara:strand:- start:40 stop:318 length:279 start_codon:yes stop_codon:yes gene_type:complete